MSATRVLILGYGGSSNTGSEIRMLRSVAEVRAALPGCAITVATIDRDITLRTIEESEDLTVHQLPYVFPRAVWRLVGRHDVVVLVEGSTFQDNWSSALLYLFLWAGWSARRQGKATIAYAVDAGALRAANRRPTRHVIEGMDLVIMRTEAACQRLRDIGVGRELHATTDLAFLHRGAPARPDGPTTVGLAPVDAHIWPVRLRPWGRRDLCYHWPYYFSDNADRTQRRRELVRTWAALAQEIVVERGWQVTLIAMEQLDVTICNAILAALPDNVLAHITTSYAGERSAIEVTDSLRTLDLLVTSRYHAAVLSLEGGVPQAAFFHDHRLGALYDELGIARHAHPVDDDRLAQTMPAAFAALIADAEHLRGHLARRMADDFLPRAARNEELLADWAAANLINKELDPCRI
jgi:polysaccharide pyruvyl transferase WcaK-like protein